jgi:hypothetical protein
LIDVWELSAYWNLLQVLRQYDQRSLLTRVLAVLVFGTFMGLPLWVLARILSRPR